MTFDVDVVPDTSAENLRRLSAVLDALDARVGVDGSEGGVAFAHDPDSLELLSVLDLITTHGDFDIAFHPGGIPCCAEWRVHRQVRARGQR